MYLPQTESSRVFTRVRASASRSGATGDRVPSLRHRPAIRARLAPRRPEACRWWSVWRWAASSPSSRRATCGRCTQIGGVCEEHTPAVLDEGKPDRRRQMALSAAARRRVTMPGVRRSRCQSFIRSIHGPGRWCRCPRTRMSRYPSARTYLGSIVDRVEVDDRKIRIGRKDVLEQAVLANGAPCQGFAVLYANGAPRKACDGESPAPSIAGLEGPHGTDERTGARA
jgi:hypothetical protein